jgi:hypothetical protein
MLLLASYTVLKTSGSHPGSSGAPGDLTCAQPTCHTDAQISSDSGLVNTLLFSSPDTTYIPGKTYTLTLQVNKPFISKFGFELVALKDSNATNIGTITPIETTRTQLLNYLSMSNDPRVSITHKSAGTTTSTAGSIQWRMKWQAPWDSAGTITFWYASNCTNNNGQNTGDKIFLSKLQIRPYVAPVVTGVDNVVADDRSFTAFYNAGNRSVDLGFYSGGNGEAKIFIYDESGREIAERNLKVSKGSQTGAIRLPENLPKGVYLVKLEKEHSVTSKKIIIEQ